MPEAQTGVRLDIWLWAARFHKTRSLAKQAIEAGRVEVNGNPAKPSRHVQVNDRLRISRAQEVYEVIVLGLDSMRGPASRAQGLYAETEASRARRESDHEQRRLSGAAFDHPPARPDKQARRRLLELKQRVD